MQTWHWKTVQSNGQTLTYLTCSLLEPWPHGFFTRQFSPQPPDVLTPYLSDQATSFRVKQVHGNRVLSAAEIEAFQQSRAGVDPSETSLEAAPEALEMELKFPDADGVFTQLPEQAAWVCTADCTPALIADVQSGNVAAVHAGWRGTAQAVVPHAIAHLQSQGSERADLRIALGPAISGEVYQVSTQVAAEVGASVIDTVGSPAQEEREQTTDAILQTLQHLPDPPILADPQPGRARLDVRRINVLQLKALGIDVETQVAIAPHCTYQDPDHFFSYRRNRLKRVQWSGIVSRS